jgi:hypothetical protein
MHVCKQNQGQNGFLKLSCSDVWRARNCSVIVHVSPGRIRELVEQNMFSCCWQWWVLHLNIWHALADAGKADLSQNLVKFTSMIATSKRLLVSSWLETCLMESKPKTLLWAHLLPSFWQRTTPRFCMQQYCACCLLHLWHAALSCKHAEHKHINPWHCASQIMLWSSSPCNIGMVTGIQFITSLAVQVSKGYMV